MKKELFASRHVGPSAAETAEMLEVIGASDMNQLISEVVPASIRLQKGLNLKQALSEREYLDMIQEKASKNKVFSSFVGQGYYGTFVPSVILRNVFESPYWYTAYTPYQAEISQGRMESLLNFQTIAIDLTGLPLANASLLDEATAAAEAMNVFFNNRSGANQNARRFFVADTVYAQTLSVLLTRAEPLDIEIVCGDPETFVFDSDFFGALVQYPNAMGTVEDYRLFVEKCHAQGIKVAVATDLMALTLLTPPGEWGADIAFGSAQRFGVPMGFGGPHAAFFCTKEEFKRQLPGRIIGVTVDAHGNPALRMALQTREQHIKRDKATSNICTAQALLANMAAMYAVYHGPQRLKDIASNIHETASVIFVGLRALGAEVLDKAFFDTVFVKADTALRDKLRKEAEKQGCNFFYGKENWVGISCDELTTMEDAHKVIGIFAEVLNKEAVKPEVLSDFYPEKLKRKSAFLQQKVFNSFHSETELMRYINRLERKDIGLNYSMIALGSCTMKLNAATELIPLSRPEFAGIHPFAPKDQVQGYMEIIEELSADLCEITGFDAVSLQPNSGAQGEYAGLMAIRNYFKAKGETQRSIALIPSSAHGTNPASAVMAGLSVVVVKCDQLGNIDVDDLKRNCDLYGDKVACLMVTYPSTHGVYEERIREITDMVHAVGGQVYMDGANMNAQVGLTSPGNIGADVCHLNLHKTFAIPHGGGGPGMGPIGVRKHLAPHLPGHAYVNNGEGETAVSAAAYGSALILLISYAYIKMLGADGLKESTQYAILNANYLKEKLKDFYPALYTADNGRVAHEFIADCREFKRSAGIEVADIAKRLMDYGYHAPTVSFPVAGTLMIEPTESESKTELDRFIETMIAIREEIREIEMEKADKVQNVLKNAPHTCATVVSDAWDKPYSREKAAFPVKRLRTDKFWPSVARVNEAYGDRNLICTCVPLEAYIADMVEA